MTNEKLHLNGADYLAFQAHWINLKTFEEVLDETLLSDLNELHAKKLFSDGRDIVSIAKETKSANPGLSIACCALYLKSIGSGKDNGNVLAIAISAKRKLEKKHPGVDLAAEAQDVIDNVENYLASHPQCKTAGSVDLSLAGLCLDVVERAMKGALPHADENTAVDHLQKAEEFIDSACDLGASGYAVASVKGRFAKLAEKAGM